MAVTSTALTSQLRHAILLSPRAEIPLACRHCVKRPLLRERERGRYRAATQIAPEARATGVCTFSAALYLGQPAGVAIVAPVIDRFGARPVFVLAGVLLPALGLWFAGRLARGKQA
jgi:MFS family permease